jgi:hypothetical protein
MHKNDVMKKYVTDEMSKFKNFDDLEGVVNSLTSEKIYEIGKWLSSWRRNTLYSDIFGSPTNWLASTIAISNVELTNVKSEIDSLFKRHNYSLEEISRDREICTHSEFRSQGEIKSKSLIAIKNGDKFKVIDGIHRAVRLACDGTKEFELMYFLE